MLDQFTAMQGDVTGATNDLNITWYTSASASSFPWNFHQSTTIAKDRLYADAADSPRRRATQTTATSLFRPCRMLAYLVFTSRKPGNFSLATKLILYTLPIGPRKA